MADAENDKLILEDCEDLAANHKCEYFCSGNVWHLVGESHSGGYYCISTAGNCSGQNGVEKCSNPGSSNLVSKEIRPVRPVPTRRERDDMGNENGYANYIYEAGRETDGKDDMYFYIVDHSIKKDLVKDMTTGKRFFPRRFHIDSQTLRNVLGRNHTAFVNNLNSINEFQKVFAKALSNTQNELAATVAIEVKLSQVDKGDIVPDPDDIVPAP